MCTLAHMCDFGDGPAGNVIIKFVEVLKYRRHVGHVVGLPARNVSERKH